MKTNPGVREVTFDAAAGDRVKFDINFSSLVAQHGNIVVADCVITAATGYTLHSSTWSLSDTLLTLVMTVPSTPATYKLAATLLIKFTTNEEELNFEAYFDLS